MKRILLALGFAAVLAVPANAQVGSQKTPAALNTEVTTNFADNTSGLITPAIVRQMLLDQTASYLNVPGLGGDCTSASNILITCTKTGGTAFGPIVTLGIGAGLASSGGNLNATSWVNTVQNKTTTYVASITDCGTTLALGGGASYTLTIGAASGFTANCAMAVANVDTVRGKTMAINGVTWPYGTLYPGQTFLVYNVNNAWVILGSTRFRPPGGTFNVFVDFANGLDTNDGLAAGAGNALKTAQACVDRANNDADFSGTASAQTIWSCNLLAGSTDTQGVHFSTHGLVGAQGGAALLIQGNGGAATISPTGADALGFFLNANVQIKNLTLATTSSGACLNSGYHTHVDVLTGVTFGACAGGQVACSDHGEINLNSSYAVTGAAPSHWFAGGPCKITIAAGITITGGTFNYATAFALGSNQGQILYGGAITLSGFNAGTSQKYNMSTLSNINTGGTLANLPGSGAGTVNCTTGASSIGSCGMAN